MSAPTRLRRPQPGSPPGSGPSARGRGGALGLAALGLLCTVYAALAALPAASGSKLVLATQHGGGSPHWLLGPLRFAGLHTASGRLGGPLFYAGLWIAFLLWIAVLVRGADIPVRAA